MSVTNNEDLLDFRTMWLRVVVEAWRDPDFKNNLIKCKDGGAEDVIMEHFKIPENVIPKDLTLVVQNGEGFCWDANNRDWSTDLTNLKDESLTLLLPMSPMGIQEDLRPIALANYYEQFPSVLKNNTPISRARVPTNHDFLPSMLEFANLEVVILHAISEAWDTWDDKIPDNYGNLPDYWVKRLLQFNKYVVPWNLKVKIRHDRKAQWTYDEKKKQGTWNNSKHILTLNLPAIPDVPQQALALASYNAVGAACPFTCCA